MVLIINLKMTADRKVYKAGFYVRSMKETFREKLNDIIGDVSDNYRKWYQQYKTKLLITSALCLGILIGAGYYTTTRKAYEKGRKNGADASFLETSFYNICEREGLTQVRPDIVSTKIDEMRKAFFNGIIPANPKSNLRKELEEGVRKRKLIVED